MVSERGLPSQVKGAGFRVPSRRGSRVQIPPPALTIFIRVSISYSNFILVVTIIMVITITIIEVTLRNFIYQIYP